MANKRQLKKQIHYVCGDLAAEIIIAGHMVKSIDRQVVTNIVNQIAALQVKSLANCSFSFDKTKADFADGKAYHTARAKYNKAAFRHLKEEFNNAVTEIVKAMNTALPAEQKEANKKVAGK